MASDQEFPIPAVTTSSAQTTRDELDPSIYEVFIQQSEGMLIWHSILYRPFHH